MKNKSARVVSHGEGRALRAFGDEIVIHLDGQDTHGTLTMWTGTYCRVVGRRRIITRTRTKHFASSKAGWLSWSMTRGMKSGRAALLSCRAVLFHIQKRWRSTITGSNYDDALRV
jgi:hypothetical protein